MTLLASAIAAACSFDASGTTLREAAGAAPGYSFCSTGGDYRYFWRCDGDNGAKSGGCYIDGVNSWMDVVVQGPANITFDWKVESESGYDGLAFYDDNNQIDAISGGSGWRSRNYTISDSKAHVIRFKYYKDESCSEGSDCGWVKNFQVTRAADLLPDEYIQYVSLKTDGGAAINSGYSYVSGTRIDVEWVLDATSSFGGLSIPSGASTLTCQGANAYVCDGGAESSKVLSIGGTASGNSCPLFLLDKAGAMTPGDGEKIVGDIYSFRILDSNNVVQRNMIPCQRIADRVAGFYDTVGGDFYPSVTDAAFTAESRVGGYIITLDAQGGTGGTTGIKVMFGDMVPTIEVPTRSGFDFLGYFDENGTQYYDLAGYGVRTWDQDADVTLKASWDGDNTSLFLPPGDAGTKYVVSNLTAGVEVERFCETADGRVVYRLPVGVRASVSCAPSAGCFVVGTNPYVIDSVTAGMAVDAAVLPRGVTQTQLELESVFDTANTAAIVKQMRDEDDELLGILVILGQDYKSLVLSEDLGAVTLDLNGWAIRGADGENGEDMAPGSNGGAAITVSGTKGASAGVTAITIMNDTASAADRPASGSSAGVFGGNGGNGGSGGAPGRGSYSIADSDGQAYTPVVDSLGLVKNGKGGLLSGVVVDTTSDYVPTTIINGSFDTEPWIDFAVGETRYTRETRDSVPSGSVSAHYPNGVDMGWNTTETVIYGDTLFEYSDRWWEYMDDGETFHGYFIEMNANNNAVFSQDLTTHGGDVVHWTFRHGYRQTGDEQSIRVEIGAPAGAASGVGSEVDANIVAATKAVYTGAGVTNPDGAEYGYEDSLGNLCLPDGTWCNWYDVSGLYLIPEGQDVTRFAFMAISPNGGCGNLLDDLTFSTLIGNLKAKANDDGSVTFTGYWGDADTSKHLRMEFNGLPYDLDMSGVLDHNFTVTVPYSLIGGAMEIDVYHQDYPQAKRKVIVQHPEQFKVVVDGTTFKAWCTNEAHSVETGCPHSGEEHAIECPFVAEDRAYTGLPYVGAALSGESYEWTASGFPLPFITYAVRGSADFSETVPITVGSYTARAAIGELVAVDDFEIIKATLTVTADDKLAYCDGEVPEFTAVVTGFVNGETECMYMGAPAFTCEYTKEHPLTGDYAIVPSSGTLESSNYTFAFVNGVLKVVDHHRHCICCGKVESHGHAEVEWLPWTSTTSLPTSAGNWYLTDDVELSAAYVPADGVSLCLNGHVVRQTAEDRVITVNDGCTFQLTDCNPSVVHKFSVGDDGVWVLNEDSGTKDVFGGCITGGSLFGDGAGVQTYGTFNMYGCNIVGNQTLDNWDWWDFYNGGGVKVGGWDGDGGEFNLYGGAVLGNHAGYGGAVSVRGNGTFVASDGRFNSNHASQRGGALFIASRCSLTGVEVCDNSADECGAVNIESDYGACCSGITNSLFCGNTANASGAIRLCYQPLTIEDVVVTNNTAASGCGGFLYDWGANLTVGGSTVVKDNLANGTVSNVKICQGRVITVSTVSPLSEEAHFGVTTEQTPKVGNPVSVTSNRGDDYQHFSSDNPEYLVVNEAGVVKLAVPAPAEIWQVGDNVYAYTNGIGTLYIYGSGATWDFTDRKQPFAGALLKIKRAVVDDGVTEIGQRFFKKCYNMQSITCAESVERFRERAFYLCTSLESIEVRRWGWGFDLDCLKDAIVYQMAIGPEGSFFMIPNVSIPDCDPYLYGKEELTDPEWTPLGYLYDMNLEQLKNETNYHFFQTRLECWGGGGG